MSYNNMCIKHTCFADVVYSEWYITIQNDIQHLPWFQMDPSNFQASPSLQQRSGFQVTELSDV